MKLCHLLSDFDPKCYRKSYNYIKSVEYQIIKNERLQFQTVFTFSFTQFLDKNLIHDS